MCRGDKSNASFEGVGDSSEGDKWQEGVREISCIHLNKWGSKGEIQGKPGSMEGKVKGYFIRLQKKTLYL